jgi:PAS domain S-box-containing protein
VLLIAADGVDALGPGLTARHIPRLAEPFTGRELRCAIELALSMYDAVKGIHALEDRFFWTSIDLLCFLDFSGYFKRLNPSWERTLGFTREELMSRPFIEFVHPDDRERTLQQNARVRAGGQALAFENRYLCKDGSYRWFRWNAAPDSAEQVIYSVARDVTEHKQAEEERERLVVELQEALAEVRTLQEILPICSYCKNIRDDANYWHSVEGYISQHTNARFSHSICPSCYASEVLPQFDALDKA